MNFYRFPIAILLMLSLALLLNACSGGGKTPIQTPTELVSTDSLAGLPGINVDQNSSNRTLVGTYTAELDPLTKTASIQPNRISMGHINVTSYLTPQITVLSTDPLTSTWTVKITIKNTLSISGYDLRLIVYTDNSGFKLMNPDNWTAQWDIAGGMQINPFIAYAKTDIDRKIKANTTYSEIAQLYMPVYVPVNLALDVCYPGNCLEPYEISHTQAGTLLDKDSKSIYLRANVYDHQDDVNSVSLYCPAITGVTTVPFSNLAPNVWELHVNNDNNAAKGKYIAAIIASSTGSGSVLLYDVFTLDVAHNDFPTDVLVNSWNAANGRDWANAAIFDGSGNVYAGGVFMDTVDFGDGIMHSVLPGTENADACLVKYNSSGQFQWVGTFGSESSASEDAIYCIAVDNQGYVYAAGFFQNTIHFPDSSSVPSTGGKDCFLVKYTSEGQFIWAKTWGGPGHDYVYGIAADSSGNTYVTGYFAGNVDFGNGLVSSHGGGDAYICKYDPNHVLVWVKIVGGTQEDQGTGMTLRGNKLCICGRFSNSVDFGDGIPRSSAGSYDGYLLIINTDNSFVRVNTWGGPGWDEATGLALDSANNMYVTGYFESTVDFGSGPKTSNGSYDCYLLKFNSSYNFLSVRTWGGNSWDQAIGVAVGKNDFVYVIGNYYNPVDFGDGIPIPSIGDCDLFITKYTSQGKFKGVKTYGVQYGSIQPRAISGSYNGDVVYCGFFMNSVDFGDGHVLTGDLDAMVVHFMDIE